MVACVKIARTCLLKVNNKTTKYKKIQKQQQKYKKTKYKNNNKNIKNKIQKQQQKYKKNKKQKTQCPSKDIVFYASYGNTHHMADYIICHITSSHVLPHTLQPSLGKRP